MANELQLFNAVCEDIGAVSPNELISDRVQRLLKDGAFVLCKRAGADVDFAADKQAGMLLTAYCRHAHSQAEHAFFSAYAEELTELNLRYRIIESGESDENDEND